MNLLGLSLHFLLLVLHFFLCLCQHIAGACTVLRHLLVVKRTMQTDAANSSLCLSHLNGTFMTGHLITF